MAPSFILLPNLLPVEEIRIPSLIQPLEAPDQDAYPTFGNSQDLSNLRVTSVNSLTGFLEESNSTKLSAAMTQLLKANFAPKNSQDLKVSSKLVKDYRLRDQKVAFRKLCEERQGKEWIEMGIEEGAKSYLLVGCVTVSDAEISQGVSTGKHVGGEVTVPVGTIVGHGIDVLGGAVDPSLGIERKTEQRQKTSFTAPGEMVCAIACRRLKYSTFKKKTTETATLDEVRWVPLSRKRGQPQGEEEEVQIDLEEVSLSGDEDDDGDEDEEAEKYEVVPTEGQGGQWGIPARLIESDRGSTG